jgi:hypothetical protein
MIDGPVIVLLLIPIPFPDEPPTCKVVPSKVKLDEPAGLLDASL